MNISCFDDLLSAARQQHQPQRLLLVFANAELPLDCTDAQQQEFSSGAGGALVPAVCVDKGAHELGNFEDLSRESDQFNVNWLILFASTMSDQPRQQMADQSVETILQGMVEAIKVGALANMISFDRQGQAIALHQREVQSGRSRHAK